MHQNLPEPFLSAPPPAWSAAPLDRRLDFVRQLRRLVADAEAEFSRLASAELHKPRHETLTADVMPFLAACRWLERRGPSLLRPRRIRGGAWWQFGQSARVLRAPLGHVAIIATWNYPVQLLGVQLIQAVAAGNRITVKPSEHAARTQGLLLDLAQQAAQTADLPPTTIRRTAATREAGAALLAQGGIDHVVFTGSTTVGRAIAQQLAPTLTSSTLELSGCDSALVRHDADVRRAAEAIWLAFTMNAGQTCMAPRRVLADRRILPELIEQFVRLHATAPARALVNPSGAAAVRTAVREALARGGRLLSASVATALEHTDAVLPPLVVVDAPADGALANGAHFGPALALLGAGSDEELLALHRRYTQRLATAVFTRDAGWARTRAAELGSGLVTINDAVLASALPGVGLGGHGPSGWGCSRGADGLLALTRPVYVTATRVHPGAAPPAEKVVENLARIVRWWYGGAGVRGSRPYTGADTTGQASSASLGS